MSSKKTRAIQKRRDRRKAKQSDYARPGKKKYGVVGHGPAGTNRLFLGVDTEPPKTAQKKRPKVTVLEDVLPGPITELTEGPAKKPRGKKGGK